MDIIYEDELEQIWWSTYDNHFFKIDKARKHTYEQPYDSLPQGMIQKIAESSKCLDFFVKILAYMHFL